jgi:predicted DNA-binding ribbon-helix-helix protein
MTSGELIRAIMEDPNLKLVGLEDHPHSIYLEPETWDALAGMAAADGTNRQELLRRILEEATETGHPAPHNP